ncbi:MFS transporter [Streptomyces sp. ISL-12]|uniref:MFS transporter n=1 Tax=Streptomyces sp. ISL-12 TaxID=2819177 RepID=UPI001BEBA686|nr:MFS transporter [Streptomyces sp. ISL-12]MBT2412484.1 MFS transporter [Streptomyces sp. ISL-12]
MSKVIRHLVPLAVIGLFVSFVDRTNIAVAGPAMESALGLTPAVFGLASGLFFVGYVLFEVPSNLALRRYGAKMWIARIMVSWGVVCMLTALVQGVTSLYVTRLLLGIAEAGFYPGVLFYLSLFLPARRLTRAYSLFQIGIPVSLALGSVLTSALLTMDGLLGIADWQWVFIIEGALAVVIGVVSFVKMPSTPKAATWLSDEEKTALQTAIERDQNLDEADDAHGTQAVWAILRNRQVWYYSVVYMLMMLGFYSVTYWLPQVIELKMHAGTVTSGLLSAIPWTVATIALVIASRRLQNRSRRTTLAITLAVSAAGMLLASLTDNAVFALLGLCIGACIQVAVPLLYSFPSQHFPGAKGAVALALVNSIGNIGGFIGPYLLGLLRESTSSDRAGLLVLSSSFMLAAVLSLGLQRQLRKSPAYIPETG